jgi:hypothetical protein
MTFKPETGDTVMAPHKLDAVSGDKHPVEFVRWFTRQGHKRAELRDGPHGWDVEADTVEPAPSEDTTAADGDAEASG